MGHGHGPGAARGAHRVLVIAVAGAQHQDIAATAERRRQQLASHVDSLRQVVELNVRMTMGRVALELYQKTGPASYRKGGRLRLLRKNKLSGEQLSSLCSQVVNNRPIVINNPHMAREFIAVWTEIV